MTRRKILKSGERFAIIVFLTVFAGGSLANDVIVVGSDGDGGDEFSFVVTRDFIAGEIIYFTEDEYSDPGGTFVTPPGEGHISYIVPVGGLMEGEVVIITESAANTFSVSGAGGTATIVAGSGDWSFSTQDEIYAYTATNAMSPWNSVTDVYCFYWTSIIDPLPTQIVSNDFPNAVYLEPNNHPGNPGNQNIDFMTGAARVNTTLADLAVIGNWNRTVGDISLSSENFTNEMLPVQLQEFSIE